MNHALLQLAWGAEQPSSLSPVPTTDAVWASYAQTRIDVYARRAAPLAAVAARFPPALRMPTSLDVCDATGAPTAEDLLRADMDRRDLWRLALEVPPWRGPFTPGLMRLLLWTAAGADAQRRSVLRLLEQEALGVWISHPSIIGAAVVEIVGRGGPTPAAPARAAEALEAIETLTWGAVELELYSAAVAAGLVPRVWRRNPIPTRLVAPERP